MDKITTIEFHDKDLLGSINIHGQNLKETIAIEEMSELIKEICKDQRGELRRDNLVEEFADVMICMRMLSLIHDIKPEEVQRWIDNKVARQKRRDLEYIRNKLRRYEDDR